MAFGSKSIVEKVQTTDIEYWTGWAIRGEYYEYWNERVSCKHPKYTTDIKGRSQFAGYEHFYDVDEHPPYWQIIDSNGIAVYVDSTKFEYLCNKFNNRQFQDMHRFYHTANGNMYHTDYQGDEIRMETITTKHNYENRIKVSNSIFKYADVNPKTNDLFSYPPIVDYYNQACILGNGGVTQPIAEIHLQRLNAKLGASKQVKAMILIFKDKPLQAALDQECFWKGGNKNEYIVAIGINSKEEPTWCYIISWTEVESLKIETRDFVMSQKRLDLDKTVKWLEPAIGQKFRRKHFKDFNYLTVEPPGWAVILVYVLTIAMNTGLAFWIIQNQYDD